MQELTRRELIELVNKIKDCDGTEEEIDNMILILEKNVPHPEVSDLIFWGEEKTAEQIVDIALNYKPIIL
ncbi:bacteriocin immunity protein [Lacrimispora sp.]|uniref:bacteriocin immunity protein n=1 Tax=Lacrimispora sp. TaxID=2719234 RepID=UPI0029E746FD|nr:hypothetical protein [Lacrimispora sp.]